MSFEVIPCRTEISPEDGTLKLTPIRELKLRPGEYAVFTANPPQAVVHRAWFWHRWYVASRAHISGERGPNLRVTEEDDA